jgi:2-polyprenyl-3-methyl-5-hydroxy-6-metoxy-1,4-benzoquinol methylase
MWGFLRAVLSIRFRLKRAFKHSTYDSSAYWRKRASGAETSKVLWHNEDYNNLYRKVQRDLLKRFVSELGEGSRILDIGCGTGVVSRMLVEMNPEVSVDGVDFSEMIACARLENPSVRIRYIESSAEEYCDPNARYHFIISSGCFSAMRCVEKMEKAILNCVEMLDQGGMILMMDPFHRWNYLARTKYSSSQMISFMKRQGLEVILKSGTLFWPYRDWLANSVCGGERLERRFMQGEKMLSLLGQHAWADYKILGFRWKREAF